MDLWSKTSVINLAGKYGFSISSLLYLPIDSSRNRLDFNLSKLFLKLRTFDRFFVYAVRNARVSLRIEDPSVYLILPNLANRSDDYILNDNNSYFHVSSGL
jgi:hypothetical protein